MLININTYEVKCLFLKEDDMKVINVAGFEVKFEKNGKTYRVPNDGLLHIIPDVCFYEDNFQGLLRVIVPPTSIKKVIKKIDGSIELDDPSVKEIIIKESENKPPLAGKRIKSKIRSKLKKTKNTGRKKQKVE
jgi:hypothetical protein